MPGVFKALLAASLVVMQSHLSGSEVVLYGSSQLWAQSAPLVSFRVSSGVVLSLVSGC